MALAILICLLSMGTQLALGLLVLAKSPGHRVNQVFALLMFLFFLWSFGELLLMSLPFQVALPKLLFTPIVLLPYVFAWFAAIFPKRWEGAPILKTGASGCLFFVPTLALLFLLWTDRLVTSWEPIENGFLLAFGRFEFLAKGIVVGYLLLVLHSLSEVWKKADSDFQLRRLRYTFAALALPGTAGPLFIALGRWYLSGYSAYTFGLFPTLGVVMSCILAYAILRYNLMEIDLFFSIGLVYTLLTAILAGILELLENGLQNILDLSSGWTTIVSTLFIAALFSPMKDLLVRLVDRLFGKRSFDSGEVMRQLLAAMRKEASSRGVLAAFLRESAPFLDFSEGVISLKTGLVVSSTDNAPVPAPGFPDAWLPFNELDAIIEAGQDNPGFSTKEFKEWRERGFRLAFPIGGSTGTFGKKSEGSGPGMRRYKGTSSRGARLDADGMQVVGALFLAPKLGKLPYSPSEKSLMASVCEEIPPILENLALLEAMVAKDRISQEIDWAKQMYSQIQADTHLTQIGSYELILFSSLAREIRGDLIDLRDSPNDRFIAVHDAFHHGILAALTLHLLYGIWRSSRPEDRMEKAHSILREFSDPPLRSAVTCLCMADSSVTVSNAGNPPPQLYSEQRGLTEVAGIGKPLGLEDRLEAPTCTIELPANGFLFCCTNGLAKAFGDPAGKALFEFLATKAPDGMPSCHQALQNRLTDLPDRAGFPDDITYVFIRRGAGPFV